MTIGSDCEIIHSGLLDQPANAISSLAFVVVAVMLRHRPVLAVLAAATGIGSFVYHGFEGSAGRWAHDVSLLCLILGITYEPRVKLIAGVSVLAGIVLWALPSIAGVLTATVAINGVAILVHRGSMTSPRAISAVAVLVGAAVVNSLARTGQPWCSPEALLQGHGVWHVGAAFALFLWGRAPAAKTRSSETAT